MQNAAACPAVGWTDLAQNLNSPRGWKTSTEWKLALNVNFDRFFHDRYISCYIYNMASLSFHTSCTSVTHADLPGWQDWTETMGTDGSSKHWLDYDILLSRNGAEKLGLECGVGWGEGAAPVWCHACEVRCKRAELQGRSWFLRNLCLTWRCSEWKRGGTVGD